MHFIGHTMGVPNLKLEETMKLFRDIGFDGIEIRCAENGHIDTETVKDADIEKIKNWSDLYNMPVTCLTSYYRDFITDKRESEINNLKKVIVIARSLNTPLVRLYGGIYPPPDGYSVSESWNRTVTGIKELAVEAQYADVKLCIETHNGSLTYSAMDAVKMVKDVNHPNAGILLDFAWVHLKGEEGPEETVEICRPYIMHCHYKDWQIEPDGSTTARLMGEGNIPWNQFFKALKESGYTGTLSDEYEKFWHPESLPEASEGMMKNLTYVKNCLSAGGGF
jgi:sugar phosphate isomerase/epimerase